MNPIRLAIIATHPIQYYAPWFRNMAEQQQMSVRVFYLWNPTDDKDIDFDRRVEWDVPLLDGYEHEFVENTAKKKGTHSFWGLKNNSLTEQVAEWKPNAVLCTAYNYQTVQVFLSKWKRRTPVFFRGDSHRLVNETGIKVAVKKVVITKMMSRFDQVLSVGKANEEYFFQHGIKKDRMASSPHAVDNEWFENQCKKRSVETHVLREELGIKPTDQVVLFSGKFIHKKNPDQLIEAFRNIKKPYRHLVLCGSGEMESQLRKEAEGTPNIHFVGFRNQSEMPMIYGLADLIVLPSSGRSETWGLCINEAMACGVPALVSTQVGCAQNLILPGETGLVFEAKSVSDLTSKLEELLSEHNDLMVMGKSARAHIQNYSYAEATQGIYTALRQVGHKVEK